MATNQTDTTKNAGQLTLNFASEGETKYKIVVEPSGTYEQLEQAILGGNANLVKKDVIAAFCGLTSRRIEQLTQDGVIEATNGPWAFKSAAYDFLLTISNLLTYFRDKQNEKKEQSKDLEEQKLRRETALAELKELELAKIKGELHTSEAIEKEFGNMLTRIRVSLLAIPLGVAPLLLEQTDATVISQILEERLYRCLNEIINYDVNTFIEASGEQIGVDDNNDE
ncbi:MAG: hypothetical protein FWD82_08970 [Defluviitaleaceae bacterium]|nr:hypothetical protein [Defluviitaleaceae bacterium]